MVERICPACRFGNTVNSHYCNKCGAPLEQLLPANRDTSALTIAGRSLPVSWRQLGTTVAVSAAALAAEAGLAWLRRRAEQGPAGSTAKPDTTALVRRTNPAASNDTARSITTIISERVIEIFDSSDGKRTITDRHTWRKIDE
jgi:hypothetical protein